MRREVKPNLSSSVESEWAKAVWPHERHEVCAKPECVDLDLAMARWVSGQGFGHEKGQGRAGQRHEMGQWTGCWA